MDSERPIAPFLKASLPHTEAVSPEGGSLIVTRQQRNLYATEEEEQGDATTGGGARAPPVEVSPGDSPPNGLGHHGGPAEPEIEEIEEMGMTMSMRTRRRRRRRSQPR